MDLPSNDPHPSMPPLGAPASASLGSPAPLPPPRPLVLPAPIARRSVAAAAVLGWVIPGLGQVYAGRFLKAFLMLATIGGLAYAGLAMTGFTCIDPNVYGLEFVAHAWMGGPTAAAYWHGQEIVLTEAMPHFEVGRLYVAVAGLLNIVAICDAIGCVLEHNQVAQERDEERWRLEEDHLDAKEAYERQEALLLTPPDAPEPPPSLDTPPLSPPPFGEQAFEAPPLDAPATEAPPLPTPPQGELPRGELPREELP